MPCLAWIILVAGIHVIMLALQLLYKLSPLPWTESTFHKPFVHHNTLCLLEVNNGKAWETYPQYKQGVCHKCG